MIGKPTFPSLLFSFHVPFVSICLIGPPTMIELWRQFHMADVWGSDWLYHVISIVRNSSRSQLRKCLFLISFLACEWLKDIETGKFYISNDFEWFCPFSSWRTIISWPLDQPVGPCGLPHLHLSLVGGSRSGGSTSQFGEWNCTPQGIGRWIRSVLHVPSG